MALSGKYDFKGIQKAGAAGFRAALASSPNTAWFLKMPLSDTIFEFMTNWLANKGLIVLNLGAISIEGEMNLYMFDRAMDSAMAEITHLGGRENLTPEQKKAIDDEVIKAARKFVVIGNKP